VYFVVPSSARAQDGGRFSYTLTLCAPRFGVPMKEVMEKVIIDFYIYKYKKK
jgi:hypothetical protein